MSLHALNIYRITLSGFVLAGCGRARNRNQTTNRIKFRRIKAGNDDGQRFTSNNLKRWFLLWYHLTDFHFFNLCQKFVHYNPFNDFCVVVCFYFLSVEGADRKPRLPISKAALLIGAFYLPWTTQEMKVLARVNTINLKAILTEPNVPLQVFAVVWRSIKISLNTRQGNSLPVKCLPEKKSFEIFYCT